MRDKGAGVGSTLGLACKEGLWGAAALLGTKGFESTGMVLGQVTHLTLFFCLKHLTLGTADCLGAKEKSWVQTGSLTLFPGPQQGL